MDRYVLLSEKEWHLGLFEKLKENFPDDEWILIQNKQDFKNEKLSIIKPKTIFIPHWSNFISRHIFLNYKCILFHMTDLPFGRGGSPLQNLIKLGFTETKISAISVTRNLDAGPIFLKKNLKLQGSANDIFKRSSKIIEKMIKELLNNDIKPVKQKGAVTFFKRRLPYQSNIKDINSIKELYDHIRMLDCDGYPRAFLEFKNFKIEFKNAQINDKKEIKTDVRITKK